MKTLAIVCFVMAGLLAARALFFVFVGIGLFFYAGTPLSLEVFVPRSVGMLLLPTLLTIAGLVLRKKAATTATNTQP